MAIIKHACKKTFTPIFKIDIIDYVIYHELSHFIHFDHSSNFWNLVSKYCKNYKGNFLDHNVRF